MLSRIFIFTILLISLAPAWSQTKTWCVSGKVVDSESGEGIAFVHVATSDLLQGTTSNEHGAFELCLPTSDSVTINFFHTAFQTLKINLTPSETSFVEVKLETKKYLTEEVTVKGRGQSMVKTIVPGKIELKQQDILLTPSVLGTPDLVRTLQLMPGIQSVNEGNSGIYVRGGSPGHNYIVFDDIELMNPSHLMGIYSVFNPLLVDKVEFYKGNAPVHQSERLASSIIVTSKKQKGQGYNWSGNLGNISSNITYQGLSKNKKWYVNIGFRRSYLELIQALAEPIIQEEENYFKRNKFNFFDFNGRVQYRSGGSTVALSWYKGKDIFQFNNSGNAIQLNNDWGNEGMAISWNYMFDENLSMKNSISYTGYSSSLNVDFIDQNLTFKTDYNHLQFKTDWLYQYNRHLFRWGAYVKNRTISPQDLDISLNISSGTSYNAYEHLSIKVPFSDRYTFSEKFDMYFGAALEYYHLLNVKKENLAKSATLTDDNEYDILMNGVLMANYNVSKTQSVKASYSYISQNIHLTSIASIPLPSDVWMPATKKVPSEQGHQFTLGYFKEVSKWGLEYGIEGYGKFSNNALMLRVNVEGEEVNDFEDNFFNGNNKAFGSEFSLKKSTNKLDANVSYTLGWVKQRFDEINQGAWHDAKYDRRHDLNIMCSYHLNSRIELGGVFVYATGNKATLPKGRYWMMGDIANDYDGINNYRMPVYHRLDLSVSYKLKSKLFHESVLNFSLINALNRSNPYFVYYSIEDGEGRYELDITARQVSLFPILPSLSWRYKF
ncbi:TonB-dependent receptor [Labilibacter marinus]|uniref:TonB-dependent receptor n=1 Tax=Labilibacter marinus TaxID=1477105 RepID=UPI0008337D90|nr:carboxypeptidase-like regulatory domain-containing protein [Labilibacter marinus]